jgi:hypothetical protein
MVLSRYGTWSCDGKKLYMHEESVSVEILPPLLQYTVFSISSSCKIFMNFMDNFGADGPEPYTIKECLYMDIQYIRACTCMERKVSLKQFDHHHHPHVCSGPPRWLGLRTHFESRLLIRHLNSGNV